AAFAASMASPAFIAVFGAGPSPPLGNSASTMQSQNAIFKRKRMQAPIPRRHPAAHAELSSEALKGPFRQTCAFSADSRQIGCKFSENLNYRNLPQIGTKPQAINEIRAVAANARHFAGGASPLCPPPLST